MDIIDINAAANKAINELTKSGQIGKVSYEKKVFLSEAVYEFAFNEETELAIATISPIIENYLGLNEYLNAVPNPVLAVKFDGKVYNCTINAIEETGWFGNMALGGGEDTGEPFLGTFDKSDANIVIVTYESGKHTVGIYYDEKETVKPIDPKYLVKTIELSDYVINDNGDTINDVLFSLFSIGGGESSANLAEFMQDVTTDLPLNVVVDASALKPGMKIGCTGMAKVFKDTGTITLYMSFILNYNGLTKVDIVLDGTTDGVIYVVLGSISA